MKSTFYVIDFDSTFVQVETLEELAKLALKRNPNKENIVRELEEITGKGMSGEISYEASLKRRLKLFSATRDHVRQLARILVRKITPSMKRNREFFRKYRSNIYIVSGGFKDYMIPLFKSFGLSPSHIIANTFRYDRNGRIVGYDEKNPLSKSGGKIRAIQNLHLEGKIYVIGDGYTDYELKKSGQAKRFFVFCENVRREAVVKKADYVLPNFDEFLYRYNLPRAYSYPKNRIKVLLLENIHPRATALFLKEGYQVEEIKTALSDKELAKKIADASVLGIRTKTALSVEVLHEAKRLLAVGTFTVGVNHINLAATATSGIPVFNAPHSSTRSVAELAIGEIIILMRRVSEKNVLLHKGIWDKSSRGAYEVRGKTLGVVGYGNIGSQLSVLAEQMGMNVLFCNTSEKLALGNAKRVQTLKELLRRSDVVSIHVDGRRENTNLVGRREFALMKKGSFFLNLSRGFVVDLEALQEALKSGHLAGAAIDVYPQEPGANGKRFNLPLQGMPNVILTPHIAGSTAEAQAAIGEFVAGKIIQFVNTGNTVLSVNFPEVALPKLKGGHRLIHIHENRPGVLAAINGILGKNKINIEGQFLKTNEHVGYVITDIGKTYDPVVIEELRQVPSTIRLRILY